MIEIDVPQQLADFDQAISGAAPPDECWKALQSLTSAVVGFKLFTVMTVDMANEVAQAIGAASETPEFEICRRHNAEPERRKLSN